MPVKMINLYTGSDFVDQSVDLTKLLNFLHAHELDKLAYHWSH